MKVLFKRLYWFVCLFKKHRWEYYGNGKDENHVKLFCTRCFRTKDFKLKDTHNLQWNPLNKYDTGNRY